MAVHYATLAEETATVTIRSHYVLASHGRSGQAGAEQRTFPRRRAESVRPRTRTALGNFIRLVDCGWVFFEICSDILHVETFAAGSGIRELPRLRKLYGKGRWRKRKGVADVKLPNGTIRTAELHWYEASGIGKKEFKIKRFVD